MCFESKSKSKTKTTTNAAQLAQGTGVSGVGSTTPTAEMTDPNPKVIHNYGLSELIKQQTTEGKIIWKRVKDGNRLQTVYTASVMGYELTATADRVTFRDTNGLGSKTTTLNVSGILNTIERSVVASDPVAEFEEALAAL